MPEAMAERIISEWAGDSDDLQPVLAPRAPSVAPSHAHSLRANEVGAGCLLLRLLLVGGCRIVRHGFDCSDWASWCWLKARLRRQARVLNHDVCC